MTTKRKIGIIGSGIVGRGWAMVFSLTGDNEIYLYDADVNQVSSAISDIQQKMTTMEKDGLLRGSLSAAEQFTKIHASDSFEDCVKGCDYIQECVPENIDIKRKVFQQLDGLVDAETILASSTSCIMPSRLAKGLEHKNNVIVAHPVNPLYFVRVVEVVPSEWTSRLVVDKTKALMEEVGQLPLVQWKEVPGFVLNRLQYVILNESVNLVKDGVVSVEGVDTAMKEGLAPRYAWMGPLETIHLNAEGIDDYLERYWKNITDTSKTFKPPPPWTKDEFGVPLREELNSMVPLDQLKARKMWRDKRIAALAKLKTDLNKQD